MNKSVKTICFLFVCLNDVPRGNSYSVTDINKIMKAKTYFDYDLKNKSINTDSQNDMLTRCRKNSLIKHNVYRKKHGVPLLENSDELNQISQEWAERLAEENKAYHRVNNSNGENLYWLLHPNIKLTLYNVSDIAVERWYNEIKFIKFGWKESLMATSNKAQHFTQMIWKDSKELGTGAAISKSGCIYFVCNYKPTGNLFGSFKKNVLPPADRWNDYDAYEYNKNKADAADYSKFIFSITIFYYTLQ